MIVSIKEILTKRFKDLSAAAMPPSVHGLAAQLISLPEESKGVITSFANAFPSVFSYASEVEKDFPHDKMVYTSILLEGGCLKVEAISAHESGLFNPDMEEPENIIFIKETRSNKTSNDPHETLRHPELKQERPQYRFGDFENNKLAVETNFLMVLIKKKEAYGRKRSVSKEFSFSDDASEARYYVISNERFMHVASIIMEETYGNKGELN